MEPHNWFNGGRAGGRQRDFLSRRVFLGIWPTSAVLTVMITNSALKVLWEAVLTPVTYVVVGKLKRAEGI